MTGIVEHLRNDPVATAPGSDFVPQAVIVFTQSRERVGSAFLDGESGEKDLAELLPNLFRPEGPNTV